ncbi:MAG: hypothetical protein Q3976_08495 [Corynebacterium sp.]|nr:hypothetical protein [Corynebacterium sp.]
MSNSSFEIDWVEADIERNYLVRRNIPTSGYSDAEIASYFESTIVSEAEKIEHTLFFAVLGFWRVEICVVTSTGR